jgi:hypothetical protein
MPHDIAAPMTSRAMDAIRAALRHRRLANDQRRLQHFYLEHNLDEPAQAARLAMLAHLRDACGQWRRAIGM